MLKVFVHNIVFQKAIYLASPVFYNQLHNSIAEKEIKTNIVETLLKYILIASSVCTPFGLFSGIFVSKTDKKTAIIFEEKEVVAYQRLENT